MADDASKMDEGNAAAGSGSGKPMVDDSPIMRGGEAAKAADMANYFISYAVSDVLGVVMLVVACI